MFCFAYLRRSQLWGEVEGHQVLNMWVDLLKGGLVLHGLFRGRYWRFEVRLMGPWASYTQGKSVILTITYARRNPPLRT